MRVLWAVTLSAICLVGMAIGKLGPPGGPLKMPRESVEMFKLFSTFESVVAISDTDNDTVFECLSAVRMDIDPESKTATYKYSLPTAGEELVYHLQPGKQPGTLTLTSDIDSTPREAIIYYTDYDKCIVADVELRGEGNQCTLWTQRDVKDNVPQDCIDHFVDTCGVIVPAHSRDLCPDGEGDN